MKRFAGVVAAIAVPMLLGCAETGLRSGGDRTLVSFPSGARTLSGFLSKPPGNGPFAAVIFNHGSRPRPGSQPYLAAFYNKHGFVFFLPHRAGHGRSPGTDILSRISQLPRRRGFRAAQLRLLEADNTDVVSSVAWLKKQPFVDPGRIVMTGYSFGGFQTLLSAEKGLGIRAFVPFTPAARIWRNHLLRARLAATVRDAKGPVFLIQASNDFSTGPSEVLGPQIRAKGPPNRAKLYPAFGSTPRDAHGGFSTRDEGIAIWGADVMSFLDSALGKK